MDADASSVDTRSSHPSGFGRVTASGVTAAKKASASVTTVVTTAYSCGALVHAHTTAWTSSRCAVTETSSHASSDQSPAASTYTHCGRCSHATPIHPSMHAHAPSSSEHSPRLSPLQGSSMAPHSAAVAVCWPQSACSSSAHVSIASASSPTIAAGSASHSASFVVTAVSSADASASHVAAAYNKVRQSSDEALKLEEASAPLVVGVKLSSVVEITSRIGSDELATRMATPSESSSESDTTDEASSDTSLPLAAGGGRRRELAAVTSTVWIETSRTAASAVIAADTRKTGGVPRAASAVSAVSGHV